MADDIVKAKIHILDQSGNLTQIKSIIEESVSNVLIKIEKVMDLPDVDIVIADNPGGAIPETGVGGSVYDVHLLFVSIDPSFKSIEKVLADEIESTIAHELHHCARMRAIGHDETLLEAMVSEGLADYFDIEINNTKPRPWDTALSEEEMQRVKELAKKEYSNTQYIHSEWFFGSEEKNIPRWSGYTLGFSLVGDYLKKTGKKASELVDTRAKEFVE